MALFCVWECDLNKRTVKSVWPYCGVGCGIVMEVADNKILKVTGDKSHPTNFGRLCTKGSTCHEPVSASRRADKAYAGIEGSRDQGAFSMAEAISRTAQGLRVIIDRDGADAVSFYVSSQMSLEAQYLANKLCKGFIGTNTISSPPAPRAWKRCRISWATIRQSRWRRSRAFRRPTCARRRIGSVEQASG